MPRENVRISDAGYRLLNDKDLAERVARAIMQGKDKLRDEGEIRVAGSNVSLHLVTSMDDGGHASNDGDK